uniref:PB1 domain-containing protein n=1 Tax=Angiostrongylus cantonensis TaxID=6313 RepID=A0A0K0DBL1_ANGCA
MVGAAEDGGSIRKAHRNFENYKTIMIVFRCSEGTVTVSREAMERVIHDYYDFLSNDIRLPSYKIDEDGYVVLLVLPCEIRHAVSSVKKRTTPDPHRVRPEHLKNLRTVLINTLKRLLIHYVSKCKVPTEWQNSKAVLLFENGVLHDISNYRLIYLLSVVYKLFARVKTKQD